MTVREITDDLIRASEAARLLHVSTSTLARWSNSGILPEPVRLGPGELRHYFRSDIEKLRKTRGNASD